MVFVYKQQKQTQQTYYRKTQSQSNLVHWLCELTLAAVEVPKASKTDSLLFWKVPKLSKSIPYSWSRSWSFLLLAGRGGGLGAIPFWPNLWFSYEYRGLVMLKGIWLVLLLLFDLRGSKSSMSSDVESSLIRSSVSSDFWK